MVEKNILKIFNCVGMEMYLIILHSCYTTGRNKTGHKTLGSCLTLSIYGYAQC